MTIHFKDREESLPIIWNVSYNGYSNYQEAKEETLNIAREELNRLLDAKNENKSVIIGHNFFINTDLVLYAYISEN